MAADTKIDLRFYVTMLVTTEIVGKSEPTAKEIGDKLAIAMNPLDSGILSNCFDRAKKEYEELGATDKIAKGIDLQNNLKSAIVKRFEKQQELGFS